MAASSGQGLVDGGAGRARARVEESLSRERESVCVCDDDAMPLRVSPFLPLAHGLQ